MKKIDQLEEILGYSFQDKKLLQTALTHKSYANEKNCESNEKLEFLGDAILEFIVSRYLFQNCKDLSEGEMTKVRAAIVCEKSLYEISKQHNFGDFLNLSKSEKVNGGHDRASILADLLEAMIGAIYIDSGLEEAQKLIHLCFRHTIESAILGMGVKDYKTILQEKLQRKGNVKITYETVDAIGPKHNRIYDVILKCNGKLLAEGRRKNKKRSRNDGGKDCTRLGFYNV